MVGLFKRKKTPQHPYDRFFSEVPADPDIEGLYPEDLRRLRLAGQLDELVRLHAAMRESYQPVGLLGGDEDDRYWALYELAIDAQFERQDYRGALSLLEEFESKRIALGLTPIPHDDIQKKAIGCLAQIQLALAVKKLRHWIAHSKRPYVCSTITHHASFRRLFGLPPASSDGPPSPPSPAPGPAPLTQKQKAFMSECVPLARKRGLDARGSARFELVVAIGRGGSESVPLQVAFDSDDPTAGAVTLIDGVLARHGGSARATPPELPYPLVAVAGQNALAEWRRLREVWRAEGACPVLIGTDDEVQHLAVALARPDPTPTQILATARGRSMEAFLADRLREHRADHGKTARTGGEPFSDTDALIVERGEWSEATPAQDLGAHLDLTTGKPKRRVYVARIPTPRSWEIPAYLCYGGWNACPAPEDQVVAHRAWHERYGAEIYAVVGDVVECWVERPPEEEEAATALAREQYLYCADIVEQGTGTLLSLAASLKRSSAWFFWWD